MLSDDDITKLSASDKLMLAQRLLAALSSDMGSTPGAASAEKKALSSAELSSIQTSLMTQVQGSLSADPAATDWNAIRKSILGSPQ